MKPLVVALAALSSSCAGTVNGFILDDAMPSALRDADTGKACLMGAALVHPLAGLNAEAHRALALAEGVAAACDQTVAWEAELKAVRLKHNGRGLGEGRAAEIIDAQLSARRAHARTAARFNRSFVEGEKTFGAIGAGCPTLATKNDQFVYLFVLVSGTLALLHDTSAGGAASVPLDRLAAIARGSTCLDDAAWWHVPQALRGAAWATIPGSGPLDGWAVLDQAAERGAPSGVRIAAAIEALVANNAGRSHVLERALSLHAASLADTRAHPDWLMLDTYAYEISLHQSDLVWSETQGHRTEVFGRVPTSPASNDAATEGADPFGTP